MTQPSKAASSAGSVAVTPAEMQSVTQSETEQSPSGTLFPLPADAVAVTTDDCYTPKWVFDAMGLHFDIDVAAPVGGSWHVPCDRYFTAEDDGLAQDWGDALVWCNPPYSNYFPWADRFFWHSRMALMGILLPEVLWFKTVFARAEAVALISCDFARPDGKGVRLRQQVFVAFKGVGAGPAERLAAADRYGAVLYGESLRRVS